MSNSDAKLRCENLCLQYELYGSGDCGYEMFMNIYGEFIKEKLMLDIFNVFDNVSIFIYNTYNDDKNYTKEFIKNILKNINIQLVEFFVIIPIGFPAASSGAHAITVIYQFNKNTLTRAFILNSGATGGYHLREKDLINYAYTIDINYCFNAGEDNQNE